VGALALRSNHAGAARDLVLACARDRREILSSSFFWRGRNSDHERELVLEDRKTDNNFELNSGAFRARNRRRIHDKIDNGAGGSRATWTGRPERVDEPGGESINIDFEMGDVLRIKGRDDKFDVIAANLFSELIIKALPVWKTRLKRQGWLILSGVLRKQEKDLLRALRRNRIDIARVRRRGKWIAILARCSGTLRAADLACGKFLRRSQTAARVERNAN